MVMWLICIFEAYSFCSLENDGRANDQVWGLHGSYCLCLGQSREQPWTVCWPWRKHGGGPEPLGGEALEKFAYVRSQKGNIQEEGSPVGQGSQK